MTVTRYDAARLGRTARTPQGFLRAPARVTRTGVLTYRRADGTTVRELRRPEQVFAAPSLGTLADAPVTDLHPKGMVSPSNARQLAVGHVSGSSARADAGKYVEAQLVITDAAMISAIEKGDRREVSCGYACDLLERPGVYEGEHYDAEQTNITYNHVGLGPEKWGRAGAEVALRLDSSRDDFELEQGAALAAELDTDHDRHDADDHDHRKARHMELVTIRLDGVEAQVTPTAAQLVQRTIDALRTEKEAADKRATEQQARADAAAAELATAKGELAKASDPERFALALEHRVALLDAVRPILGDDVRLDGKTDREVKVLALQKLGGAEVKLEGKSDAYIEARFDAALELLADRPPEKPRGDEVRRAALGRKDGGGRSGAPAHASARDILAGRVRLDADDKPRKYEPPPWRAALATSRPRE